MDVEKNKNTLKEALNRLQDYEVPDSLWKSISNRIGERPKEDEQVLSRAIEQLPQHSPSAAVWNTLTKSLDDNKETKTVKMFPTKKWLSIAASIAVLLTLAIWGFSETPPKISKLYAQETMQQFQLDIDWDADESSFDKIKGQLEQLNDPQLNNLKMELEELSTARNDVEQILKSYGQDPQLLTQLGDIERQRSDIYRQIIEMI